MGKLADDLKKYFATETEEQIKKDMDELDKYNVSGPDMLSFLDSHISSECVLVSQNFKGSMDESYDRPQYDYAA